MASHMVPIAAVDFRQVEAAPLIIKHPRRGLQHFTVNSIAKGKRIGLKIIRGIIHHILTGNREAGKITPPNLIAGKAVGRSVFPSAHLADEYDAVVRHSPYLEGPAGSIGFACILPAKGIGKNHDIFRGIGSPAKLVYNNLFRHRCSQRGTHRDLRNQGCFCSFSTHMKKSNFHSPRRR